MAPTMCSKVDLPHPDGPRTAQKSPALAKKLTPHNAPLSPVVDPVHIVDH